jgi:hypothetical protein
MRKFLSMMLVTAMATATVPLGAGASKSDAASLTGTAYNSSLRPLPNANVQIRSLTTGSRVDSTVSDQAGNFSFSRLEPGTYVVELVNASGYLIGISAPVSVGPSAVATVAVRQDADGALASGQGSGFSLFGLGPVTSLAVLGAAGAASVTAVVSTRPEASPSR